MSIDSMVCVALIESADSRERLHDLGQRIKYEKEHDYEWTRNADELSVVREAWREAYERLENSEWASV